MRYDFSKIPSVRKRRYAGGGDLSAVSSGISQIAQSTSNLAQIRDTSSVEDAINDVNATKFDESGYDNLLSDWDSVRRLKTNWTGKELRGLTKGQKFGNAFAATNAGIGAGLETAGWIGAAVGGTAGLVSSLLGNRAGNRAANRKARKLNEAAKEANQNVINNFGYSTNKVAQKAAESAQKNFVAMGGPLVHRYDIGDDLTTGASSSSGGDFWSKYGSMFGNMFGGSGSSGASGAAGSSGPSGNGIAQAIVKQAAKVGTAQGAAFAAYAKPQKALNPYTGMVSRKAYKPELESDSDKFKRKMGLVTGLVAPIFDTSGSSKDVKIPDTTQQTQQPNERRIQKSIAKNGGTLWVAEGGNLRDKGGMLNEGEVYDLTPNEIARLKKEGYKFEYV